MRRDDYKFLALVVAALLLAGVVIYTSYLRDLRTSISQGVDIVRIEELAGKGVISLEEASFYEPVEEGQ